MLDAFDIIHNNTALVLALGVLTIFILAVLVAAALVIIALITFIGDAIDNPKRDSDRN